MLLEEELSGYEAIEAYGAGGADEAGDPQLGHQAPPLEAGTGGAEPAVESLESQSELGLDAGGDGGIYTDAGAVGDVLSVQLSEELDVLAAQSGQAVDTGINGTETGTDSGADGDGVSVQSAEELDVLQGVVQSELALEAGISGIEIGADRGADGDGLSVQSSEEFDALQGVVQSELGVDAGGGLEIYTDTGTDGDELSVQLGEESGVLHGVVQSEVALDAGTGGTEMGADRGLDGDGLPVQSSEEFEEVHPLDGGELHAAGEPEAGGPPQGKIIISVTVP